MNIEEAKFDSSDLKYFVLCLKNAIKDDEFKTNNYVIKEYSEFFEPKLELLENRLDDSHLEQVKNILLELDERNNNTILNTAAKNKVPLHIILIILRIVCKLQILDAILFMKNERRENILHLIVTYKGDDEDFEKLMNFMHSNTLDTLNTLIEEENDTGKNPIDIAMTIPENSKKVITILTVCNFILKPEVKTDNVLHRIAKQDNDDVVLKNFLEHQAFKDDLVELVCKKNDEGHTPFDIVLEFGNPNNVEIFYKAYKRFNSLRKVIENPKNPNNILHLAMLNKSNVIDFMVKNLKEDFKHRLVILLKTKNKEGMKPLYIAADYGDIERLQFIKNECSGLNVFEERSVTKNKKVRV